MRARAGSSTRSSGRCGTCRSRSPRARRSASSARTARARARCSSAWPASCGPTRGAIATTRQDLGPARARRRLPSRALRAREHLPQRLDPRPEQEAAQPALRRDRRVRRPRAVHRHAGEELLVGHVRAARVLGGDQRRPRHPARSTRCSPSATRSSSASASEKFDDLTARGQDDRHRLARARVDAEPLRQGGAGSSTACSGASARPTDVIDEYLDDVARRPRAPTASTARGGAPVRRRIERIELLDASGQPVKRVRTGDTVVFRFHYKADAGHRASRCSGWRSTRSTACGSPGRTPATPGSCPTIDAGAEGYVDLRSSG